MDFSDPDPKGRRKSTGGILRRPPEDNIEQEAVVAEARTKAQSKFQSRPDQRLDKTAKSPARSKKKKAGKGVKAICENLLGNFRRKNSNSGSTTTVKTNNPIKMRSSSDADALRPGVAADYVQTRRDSQPSSLLTSSGPSHTSTPAGLLPSRSASTSSVASPTISQVDDADDAAAHVAMPRRATAFAPRAVVISAQATEGEEREMTLEEEEAYLMAMMEGDATGVARARRNTVITKREPSAVEEGRRRHQRRDFKVTHVEFPEEGSYGRGFHEDVDLAFVAKGDELKDYVWGVGGASALDSSEEEEQEEGGGEEADGREEVEEEDASLEELQGSDSIETEAEEEETPPDDLVATEEDGVEEEEKDEKGAEERVESKEKQRRPEGQGAARGKRKRKVTGDESGTSAETRTELKERVMAENETEEATGPLQ